ncbi:MAG TPA: hypothetical protein VGC41_23895 [Kofleriaceae bacterium]
MSCTNCGAPVSPSNADVRKGVCQFCGVELALAIDANQIAAGMALDLRNAQLFMSQLARALGHAFGQRSRIEWASGQIVKVSVDFGKDMYVAVLDVDQVVGQKKKMVRGVALKTTTVPIDEWVVLLHEAIATHVNTNAKAAAALAQLRIG